MVDPNGSGMSIGFRVGYRFEYRQVGSATWISLGDKDAGNSFTTVVVQENLEDLPAGTSYEARLVVLRLFWAFR